MAEVPNYKIPPKPVMPESNGRDSLDMLMHLKSGPTNDLKSDVRIPREKEEKWQEVLSHRSKSPTFLASKIIL